MSVLEGRLPPRARWQPISYCKGSYEPAEGDLGGTALRPRAKCPACKQWVKVYGEGTEEIPFRLMAHHGREGVST